MTLDNKQTRNNELKNSDAGKKIIETIRPHLKNNRVSCARCHRTARTLGLSPALIGKLLDAHEIRIQRCQIGLFGYGKQKKQLDPDVEISPALSDQIARTQSGNRISCIQCWQIADAMSLGRIEVGSACDKQGLKIHSCQLGAF